MAMKPYAQRTDLEKIQSQWTKATGSLHTDEQWSAAVVRAATAAEIAANFAIRKEFAARSQFDEAFIDSLLRWANGLAGKIDRLLLPLHKQSPNYSVLQKLKGIAEEINRERNAIVHQGHFRNKSNATAVIKHSRHFVETLVRLYEPGFVLRDK